MQEIKEFLLSYKQTIITHSIAFLLAVLLFGCGTKTKTKSESESEVKAKEIALIENEKKKLDSIRVVLEENLRKEFFQKSNETNTEEGSKKTVIEVVETYSPTKDFRPVKGTDLFINDANGQLLTKTTKTIIDERFKAEQKKEIEIKKVEQERKTKDCLAVIKINETKLSLLEKKLDTRIDKLETDSKTKGWQPGFWFYAWIFIILGLIALFIYLYRKFGNPIGWFGLLFGAFKGRKNE